MANAAANSPLKKRIKERCAPQPGQSNPNSCLFKQGSIKSSIPKANELENKVKIYDEQKKGYIKNDVSPLNIKC